MTRLYFLKRRLSTTGKNKEVYLKKHGTLYHNHAWQLFQLKTIV